MRGTLTLNVTVPSLDVTATAPPWGGCELARDKKAEPEVTRLAAAAVKRVEQAVQQLGRDAADVAHADRYRRRLDSIDLATMR